MGADGEQQELRKQVKDLQRQLAEALRERDDLTRDLEAMCLSDTGTTFNSSSVLQERIFAAEKELAAARAALSATTAERDSLREDLWEVKVAKRRADQGFKAQLERAGALDKELAFYQSQSARVMADRDRAVWEGEELRAANLQLEQQLREASSRAETEASQRSQAERQLADTQAQLRAAQTKAAEAEALPGLLQELADATAEAAGLRQRQAELEAEGEGLHAQLAEACAAAQAAEAEAAERQRSVDDLAAAHAVVQQQLRGEVEELKVEVAQLSERLAAAQAAAKEARDAQHVAEAATEEQRVQQEGDVAALVEHHREEVASLRQQLTAAQEAAGTERRQAKEAAQQKVTALVRLAELEQDTKELPMVLRQLEQVKQEKLAALMRVAELQGGGSKAAVSPGRTDSAKNDAGGPAKSPSKQQQQQQQSPARSGGWWGSPAKAAS